MKKHFLMACVFGLICSALPPVELSGNSEYELTDFGDISTAAQAESTYQKAASEIIAKGGGVLVIPVIAPKNWGLVNTFQQTRDDAPVITVIDMRGGYANVLVPSIGSRLSGIWTSQRFSRTINQKEKSLPFQGTTNVQEIRNIVTHGASSYMQYSAADTPSGENQRLYLPTIRGIYLGQFINVTGASKSYVQPYDQIYVKDLGWDKEKNLPYLVGDFKYPHPKGCIVYNKHVTGISQLESVTNSNNQTMDFQVTRRQYSQGDAFLISASMFNQGDVFSGLGDERACIFNSETIFDVISFHSAVESKDPAKDEIVFAPAGTECPEKLASCRALINMNKAKWITAGSVVVVAPEDWMGMFADPAIIEIDGRTIDIAKFASYKGEKMPLTTWSLQPVRKIENLYKGRAYPSLIIDGINLLGGRIVGSPDCGWTKEVVGRYFAISDPSECITPKDGNTGYATPDAKRDVYRWYLIREFNENPDGSKSIRIERIRWAAVNAGAPLLFDRNNYTKDGHEKPMSYIIAPGAYVTDVGQGWVDRTHVTKNDPRKIKISVSPDKGSKFDFQPGDPIELAIGADPANPVGFRVRFHNQLPSIMEDSGVEINNQSRCAMNYAIAIEGEGSRLEDIERKKDKQPSFLTGINIGATSNDGIVFNADTVNSSILFQQPNNRAQPMKWLHRGATGSTALAVSPVTGDMEISGGNLSMNGSGLQKMSGVSATETQAKNLRGINVAVQDGSKELKVLFERQEADGNYAVMVTCSWMTQYAVKDKTASGFTLVFGTAAPEKGGGFDWFLVR